MDKNNKLRLRFWESTERQELARDYGFDIAATWGSVAIPLIPATLAAIAVGQSFQTVLHLHWSIAWFFGVIVGIGLEVIGLNSIDLLLELREFNETLRDGEDPAPVDEAERNRSLYVGIALGLVFVLEIIPNLSRAFDWASWVPIVSTVVSLPFLVGLGLLSASGVTLKKRHKRRVMVRIEAEAEAAKQRDLSSKVVSMADQINALNDQINALNDQINEQRNNNEQLREYVHLIDMDSDQMRVHNDRLYMDITSLNAQANALNDQINEQRNDNEQLREYVHLIDMDSDQMRVHNDKIIEGLRREIDNVQPSVSEKPMNNVHAQRDNNAQTDDRKSTLLSTLRDQYNGQETGSLNKSELSRLLGIDRRTIGKYIEEFQEEGLMNGVVQ